MLALVEPEANDGNTLTWEEVDVFAQHVLSYLRMCQVGFKIVTADDRSYGICISNPEAGDTLIGIYDCCSSGYVCWLTLKGSTVLAESYSMSALLDVAPKLEAYIARCRCPHAI